MIERPDAALMPSYPPEGVTSEQLKKIRTPPVQEFRLQFRMLQKEPTGWKIKRSLSWTLGKTTIEYAEIQEGWLVNILSDLRLNLPSY